MIAFFDDAGFIVGSYVVTFGAVALLAWRLASAGKKLGRHIPDDDKYWT